MSKLIIFLNNLSFKKIVLSSFIISLILAVPLVSILISNETNLFSSASNRPEQKKILDESLVPYPSEPPELIHVEKFYGKSGDSIVLLGKNFAEAQKESLVYLGDTAVSKTNTVYWSDNEVEVLLPSAQGYFSAKIVVNNKSASWWGKVNIYNELTPESILIDEKNNFIRVFDPTLSLVVHSLNGRVGVLGTTQVEQRLVSAPIDLITTNILNVEVIKNGVAIPYKVVSSR